MEENKKNAVTEEVVEEVVVESAEETVETKETTKAESKKGLGPKGKKIAKIALAGVGMIALYALGVSKGKKSNNSVDVESFLPENDGEMRLIDCSGAETLISENE